MKNTYLATGFQDVDKSDANEAYIACLSLLDSLPFYQEYKQQTYELLGLKNGDAVLDAGCGLGYDLYRMAEKVFPDGQAIGVDASSSMLHEAKKDPRYKSLHVKLIQADLRQLPFSDLNFSHARIDRVLQHIKNPQQVVQELSRVLQNNGILLAYDNDWHSFSIQSPNETLHKKIENLWIHSFANPTIGTDLVKLFQDVQLQEITSYPLTSILREFEVADKVYNIQESLSKLVTQGELTKEEKEQWLTEVRTSSSFEVKLETFIVKGKKVL
jgi:ubiquinone/menaquinone biosynthesis C-methylase UbiE